MRRPISMIAWMAVTVLLSAGPTRGTASDDWTPIGSGIFNTGTPPDVPSEVPHHQSGRMHQAAWAYDKHQQREILWMGASHGGLWKPTVDSTGKVTRWTPLTDNFPGAHTLGSFLVHPQDSDSILIGTGTTWGDGDGIYVTRDGGASWSQNRLPVEPKTVYRLAGDRSDTTGNTAFAASEKGLWRTTNFGATWVQIQMGPGTNKELTDLVQDPNDAAKWYVAMRDKGVIYSTDGGSHWCPLGSTIPDSIRRVSLAASRASSKYLYALVIKDSSALNGVYRYGTLDQLPACDTAGSAGSTDAWISIYADNAAVNPADEGGHTCAIAADPNNADHVIFGLQKPAETKNATQAAVTWDAGFDGGHHDYNHILFLPDGRTVVLSNDGGYYLYDHMAETLDDSGNQLGIDGLELSPGSKGGFASSRSNPNVFIAGLQDNGVILGDIGEGDIKKRIRRLGLGDGGQVSIHPGDAGKLAYSSTLLTMTIPGGHRFLSCDAGVTPLQVDCDLGGDSRSTMLIDPTPGLDSPAVFTHSDEPEPGDPGTSVSSGVFYKPVDTLDDCDWKTVGPERAPGTITQLDQTTNASVHGLFLTLNDDHRLFSYSGPRSDLGSLPFSEQTPILPATPSPADARVAADKSVLQPDTVYYTSGEGQPSSAFVSFNGGVDWKDVKGDIDPTLELYRLVANPKNTQHLYLATNKGVFRSLNGGGHWQDYSRGLRLHETVQEVLLNSDTVDPARLYVATQGRGFWMRTIVNQPPTVVCPSPIVVECASPAGNGVTASVHVEDADGDELFVTWEADGQAKTQTIAAGGPPTSANSTFSHLYAKGVHLVKVSVSDGQEQATCTTTVTVQDTTAPVVACSVAAFSLWPAQHDLADVGLSVTVTDACEASPAVTVAVVSDQDDQEAGAGQGFSPDAKGVAPGTLRLRAERAQGGDGRVYLVTAGAADSSGNAGAACCTVTVPANQSASALASVETQAAAARASCPAAPVGYAIVGDGPIVGPKQ